MQQVPVEEINDNYFDEMSRTIINGTINVLDLCVEKNAELLFVSSGAVNGIHKNNKKLILLIILLLTH